MGLEFVSIVVRTEDVFGIAIPDKDAMELDTVGKYYEYVLTKVQDLCSGKCLSSSLFYRIRQALAELFGVSRNQVGPYTDIDSLIPSRSLKEHWKQLEDHLGLRLPPLVRPEWLSRGITLTSAGLILLWILAVLNWLPRSMHHSPWAYLAAALLVPIAAYRATASLAVCIPADCKDIQGLVGRMVKDNFRKIAEQERSYNPTDVWETVRSIIVDELSVNPDEVTREARFVADLGCG
jgi:acyl carrier protein